MAPPPPRGAHRRARRPVPTSPFASRGTCTADSRSATTTMLDPVDKGAVIFMIFQVEVTELNIVGAGAPDTAGGRCWSGSSPPLRAVQQPAVLRLALGWDL